MIQSTEGASVRRYEDKTAGMVGKLDIPADAVADYDGGMTQL
jgi:hypothetical protein